MELYQNALITVHNVQETLLLRHIMNDVDYLEENKSYNCGRALKSTIRNNKRMFHDMMASYDYSTDDSTEESGEDGNDESTESVP